MPWRFDLGRVSAASVLKLLLALGPRCAMALAWRREAAHDHSRVLAQCFAGADHAPGAAEFEAQENEIWQQASSWKGYCETLARTPLSRSGAPGCVWPQAKMLKASPVHQAVRYVRVGVGAACAWYLLY